jgi:hypothetical protein
MSSNASVITKIATCYQPSDGRAPSRFKRLIQRDNTKKHFPIAVVEIEDNVGTGFNKFFATEDEAFTYVASVGFTDVVRDIITANE